MRTSIPARRSAMPTLRPPMPAPITITLGLDWRSMLLGASLFWVPARPQREFLRGSPRCPGAPPGRVFERGAALPRRAQIVGTGGYQPGEPITNEQIEALVGPLPPEV